MKRSSLLLCGCASIALAVLLGASARADITDGLRAYYPLDGDFLDASGNELHGMERGFPAIEFADGKFGQGIVLDGGNQYVEINGGIDGNIVSDLDFVGGSMSVSAWFRVDSFDTNWQALIAKGEQDAWRLHRRNNEQGLAFNAGGPDTPSGIAVNDGQIHHVVATSEFGLKKVYIDGVLSAQGQQNPIGPPNTNRNVRIGDNPSTDNREWEGLIDDVAIWDRALTVDEVALLWNNGDGTPAGFVIPEPTGIVLAVIGLLGLGAFGRRRRRRS